MSMFPSSSPGSAGFQGGYQASPHAGLPGKEDWNSEPDMETRARSALILGLLAVPFSILAGIPAIFIGAHALRRINAADGSLKGRRLAWCGIALGAISTAAFVVMLYFVYR